MGAENVRGTVIADDLASKLRLISFPASVFKLNGWLVVLNSFDSTSVLEKRNKHGLLVVIVELSVKI